MASGEVVTVINTVTIKVTNTIIIIVAEPVSHNYIESKKSILRHTAHLQTCQEL